MKVAAITITYNDGYKFKEWVEHYQEYKEDLYKHIIIDNGSKKKYLNLVKSTFIDSIIIERMSNGGCTIAYNDGIRLALEDENTDAIMLIGNDCKIEKNGIPNLYNFLYSNNKYGMCSPIMFSKDSEKIEDYGCNIDFFLYMKVKNHKKGIQDLPDYIESETVLGGLNIATREFYEKVGLQDEKLFMYSDEIDFGLRAKKSGFKFAFTKNVKSWHQHINPNNKNIRNSYAGFLISRNKIYLGYKHFGFFRAFIIFLYQIICFFKGIIGSIKNKHFRKYNFYFLFGAFCGILKKMKLYNFITK